MNTEFQDVLKAAGVKAGDEVMVQTLALTELAETVIGLGAISVFVDSELTIFGCRVPLHLPCLYCHRTSV